METKTGWRATPAPLLVALAMWLVYFLARVVILHTVDLKYGFSPRLNLTGEGVGFAGSVLLLLGTMELANRPSALPRSMMKLAVFGAALIIGLDLLTGLVNFAKTPWDHKWVYYLYEYGALAGWVLLGLGLTLSLPPARRAIGFVIIGVTVITFLPYPLRDKVWGALHLDGKPLFTIEFLLRAVRVALLALLFIRVAEGTVTTPQPTAAAEGFQLAAKGLWIRVIAACVVVMFTLMMIAGKSGGGGAMGFFKVLMMGQAIVAVLALVMTGLGALRAARSGVPDLEPYSLTLGGGASLWAAGVSLAQLPIIYKAFYGGEYGRGDLREMTEVLSIALPVIVIVGVGLLATALSGFGARRNNEELRTDAQGKGIGYVVLMLVAIAIQSWMLPKSRSVGNFAMLSLLAAGASLWGTVMMAKLLGRGADSLQMEPGLPMASVVNVDPQPPA